MSEATSQSLPSYRVNERSVLHHNRLSHQSADLSVGEKNAEVAQIVARWSGDDGSANLF
jgi:hypothetical protein